MTRRTPLNVLVLLMLAACSSKSEQPTNNSAAACDLFNATAERNASGDCEISECEDEYGNCDGDDSNGCEAWLMESEENCGSCDTSCTADNVSLTCVDGACSGDFRCVAGHFNLNGDEDDGCESNTPCPDSITVGDLCYTHYKTCVTSAACYECSFNPNEPDPAAWAEIGCTDILPETGCPNFTPDDVECSNLDQTCSYRLSGGDCWLSYICDAETEAYQQTGCGDDAEECAGDVAVDEACPTDGALCITAAGQCMVCQGIWVAECG